jgi:taurine dioxygenase
VIWDNRCTMHRARPYDDVRHRRDMRRTTVADTDSGSMHPAQRATP